MLQAQSPPSTLVCRRYTKPLAPEYQAAAEKLAQAQAQLDAHMAVRKLDPGRVAERDRALDAMVREATEPPPSGTAGGGERAHMRPLHAVDSSGPTIRKVDLTEEAVATDDSPLPAGNSIVAEHSGLSTHGQ